MNKKHDFNDKCNKECILDFSRQLRIISWWLADNVIPMIRGTGNCRYGFVIKARMSIPLWQQSWKIGSAFHKWSCKAK